jgi:hypothetical protein
MAAWVTCPGCQQYMVRTYEPWKDTYCATCAQARAWPALDEQLYAVLKQWFTAHYEDPVESCPFSSGKGGYQYIWGGPYSASEVLHEHVGHVFEEAWLAKVAERIEQECDCLEWSAVPEDENDGEV